jgi:histidinol phosphatase-like PHP family hydrolase
MKEHILADLHTHLNEKKINPEAWWNAAKEKKLSVIAITEHSNYKPKEAYLKLKNTKPEEIMLIAGMEAKTNAGDLLLFCENEKIYDVLELQKKEVNIEKALKLAKENNLVASFPHPYGYKLDSVCEVMGEEKTKQLIKKFNIGIEYYNGMLASANELLFGRKFTNGLFKALSFVEENKATKALRINKTTNFPRKKLESLAKNTLEKVRKGMLLGEKSKFVTVGSDAHYPTAIGTAIIELKRMPKDEKDFLNMIQKKETLWKGPNIYSNTPVDIIGKKEMFEGLTYLAKKTVFKKRTFPKKVGKKWISKRIKTIKRITKKQNIAKIGQKIKKIRIKKKILNLKNKLVLRK